MGALKAALLPVTPYQQNCTLIWDEATMQAAVIDPGGEVARILGAIDQLGQEADRHHRQEFRCHRSRSSPCCTVTPYRNGQGEW